MSSGILNGILNIKMNSRIINKCQTCGSDSLKKVIDLGFLPSVNDFQNIDESSKEQIFFPTIILKCDKCSLLQLSCIVDKEILFPETYPYTSSTTQVLKDNFSDLSIESRELLDLKKDNLICDIGSNDGNLLSFFKDYIRVVGITPEDIGNLAIEKGIPTIIDYFSRDSCNRLVDKYGHPDLVTATNVFAHIDNPLEVLDSISFLLNEKGTFVVEVHYLKSLIQNNQYDTIYHEHMRYYSLRSLEYLLSKKGFKGFHAKLIPSHGGSIRVYFTKSSNEIITPQYKLLLRQEDEFFNNGTIISSYQKTIDIQKHQLLRELIDIKQSGNTIIGIGAPSRGTTLLNYCGIDSSLVDYIAEIKGSHKIGKRLPGTTIPVFDESQMFEENPDYALLLSWHIADELISIFNQRGLRTNYIIPLPYPRIISKN